MRQGIVAARPYSPGTRRNGRFQLSPQNIHGVLLRCCLLGALLSASATASAGKILDYIRNYDLNNYAVGFAISGEQSSYIGAEPSTIAFPYLTSFRDSAMTDSWLVIRDGDLGFRWVTDNDWELGVVGRVQTQGSGNSDIPELDGVANREWALELGPMAGFRRWPIHINFKTYFEVSDNHDGMVSHLAFSVPYEWDNGFLVPFVEAIRRDADYSAYYWGVTANESSPTRPEYQPGSTMSAAIRARWGYALSDKWLLTGGLGLEFLDSAISDSPIVDRDEIWSATIGIAYNSNVFQPRDIERPGPQQPRIELRIGIFSDSVNSKVVFNASSGIPGTELDLEDGLGLEDQESVTELDAVFRIGDYHRVEAGYFQMGRSGLATLNQDVTFGDETFAAGTDLVSRFDMQLFRIGYAYSLVNDQQKELGFMVGLHHPEFKTSIEAVGTGQRALANTTTPLPVIGAHAMIALSQNWRIGGKAQFFRMHFDHYEGSLNYVTVDVKRQFGERFSAGLGYNYYGFNLHSRDNSSSGKLQIRHTGPVLFANLSF